MPSGLVPGDGSDELHRLMARVKALEERSQQTPPPFLSNKDGNRPSLRSGPSAWQSSKELAPEGLGPVVAEATARAPAPAIPRTSALQVFYTLVHLAGHQPGTAPKGIHYWAIMIATRAGAYWHEIAAAILFQYSTVLLQFLLLAVVVETATSTTCDFDTQTGCRSGEYCSINYARGQCNDCATVLPTETYCCPTLKDVCPTIPPANWSSFFYVYDGANILPGSGCSSTNDQVALFGQGGCIGACAMYERCISHDLYPTRCDYLVNAQDRLKITHVILLVFATLVTTSTFAQELDDMDTERAALRARNTDHYIASRIHRQVNALSFHVYSILHSAVLPGLLQSSIVTAVLTDLNGMSLSSGVSVVFSFMALLFISHVDTTLAYLLVPTTHRQRCEEIHGEMSADITLPDTIRRPVRWLHNRLVAAAQGVLIVYSLLQMETVMMSPFIVWMRDVFYNTNPHEPGYNTRGATVGLPLCNQFNQTVAVMALATAWVLSWLRNLFRWVQLTVGAASVDKKLAEAKTAGARLLTVARLLAWQSSELPTRDQLLTSAFSVLRCAVVDPAIIYLVWWYFMVIVNGHLLYVMPLSGVS